VHINVHLFTTLHLLLDVRMIFLLPCLISGHIHHFTGFTDPGWQLLFHLFFRFHFQLLLDPPCRNIHT
jgi:hypothetical protein